MPFSESLSVILKRDYGFNIFTATSIKREYEVHEAVQKRLKRKDLPFRPIVDICYERQLTRHTYLFVEVICVRNTHDVVIRKQYSFYKASYYFGDTPKNVKVYCANGTYKDVLKAIKKFDFLR